MLRKLLLATIRNSLLAAEDVNSALQENDVRAIVALAEVLEEYDTGLYFTIILFICQRFEFSRCAAELPARGPLVQLLVSTLLQKTTACEGFRHGETVDPMKLDLYSMLLFVDAQEEEQNQVEVPKSSVAKGVEAANKDKVEVIASPEQQEKQKGLGGRMSLYQKQRLSKNARATEAVAAANAKTAAADEEGAEQEQKKKKWRKAPTESEFVYFAAMEIITFSTFCSTVRLHWILQRRR